MARKAKNNQNPKFEDRVRFNWGYHGGAWEVEHNCLRHVVTAIESASPRSICREADPVYFAGWEAGAAAAQKGEDHRSSEFAWRAYKGI